MTTTTTTTRLSSDCGSLRNRQEQQTVYRSMSKLDCLTVALPTMPAVLRSIVSDYIPPSKLAPQTAASLLRRIQNSLWNFNLFQQTKSGRWKVYTASAALVSSDALIPAAWSKKSLLPFCGLLHSRFGLTGPRFEILQYFGSNDDDDIDFYYVSTSESTRFCIVCPVIGALLEIRLVAEPYPSVR